MRTQVLKDFTEGREPTEAEQTLIAAIRTGRPAIISGERPETRDPAQVIRTDLIEYLALGGCEALRPRGSGVVVLGAWIEPPEEGGLLDLQGETLPKDLSLWACHIAAPINLSGAKAQSLAFSGSKLAQSDAGAALLADRLITSGGVLLRAQFGARFEAEGAVRLPGAQIGGDLTCSGALLTAGPAAAAGAALLADGLKTTGSVFLRAGGGTRFEAEGAVRLLDAQIGGNLECNSARLTAGKTAAEGAALFADRLKTTGGVFLHAGELGRFEAEGAVRLSGAQIGGNLDCVGGRFAPHPERGGFALDLEKARIEGALQAWDNPGEDGKAAGPLFKGPVNLSGAYAARLEDAPGAWPAPRGGRFGPRHGVLYLDGFRFGAMSGARFPKTARDRVAWLQLQPLDHQRRNFRPQPWRALEAAFEAEGELLEARRVAKEREKARRRAGLVTFFRYEERTGPRAFLRNLLRWPCNLLTNGLHRLFGVIAGYGYFNLRAFFPVAALLLTGWVMFAAAWEDGAVAPPLPVVLNSEAWKACDTPKEPNPAACWSSRDKPGRDFYQFSAFLYSLDVFLPVVTIEQELSWSPTPGRGTKLSETALGRAVAWFGPEAKAWLQKRSRFWAPGEREWTLGDLAWFYRIFHEVMGYVLSAFIIAGLARLIRES